MTQIKFLIYNIIIAILMIEFVIGRMDEDEMNIINYSAEQFLGEWTLIATINHNPQQDAINCVKLIVDKTNNHEYVNMTSLTIVDGMEIGHHWLSKIFGNQIFNYEVYNETYSKPIIRSIDLYTDLELFVIYNITEFQPFTIYSRHSSIEKKKLRIFENISKASNWHLQYVNTGLCHQQHKKQFQIDNNIIDNLVGRWYKIYQICHDVQSSRNLKQYMLIERKMNNYIKSIILYLDKNNSRISMWSGKIFNSQLYEINNSIMTPSVFSLEFFNNNTEVIIEIMDKISCDNVWSRSMTRSS